MTDSQKSLVAWSRIYDSAREDAERPSEAVIADDDAFEGWMASRREAAAIHPDRAAAVAGTNNPSILNAEQVFVCRPEDDARTEEEFIEEVYGLGGAGGLQAAHSRFAAIDRAAAEGRPLSEFESPDRLLQARLAAGRARGA